MMRFVWALLGAVLFGVSKGFEAMGDAAPMAASGTSGARLTFHLLALAAFVAAAVCGWKFLRGLIGSLRKSASREPEGERLAQVYEGEASFDADAALARYLERRGLETPLVTRRAPPAPAPSRREGGFGRKRG